MEGCPGRAGTRTAMRVHFWCRHVRDIIIILEEGNLPHPRCSRCDMLVPWRSVNGRHKNTAMCRSGAERKRRQLAETEIRESTEMAFEVYTKQLQKVPSFKYLGRILTAGDDDFPAVAGNLGKARKSWGRLQRILIRDGADKRVSGGGFKAVVQQVLLFGVTTHVSAPNSRTCWTTALENPPDTLLSDPSLLSIRCSRPQLFRAFPRFPATAGQ